MHVRQGWSGQVSRDPDRWAKFDIELEEQDLRRVLAGAALESREVNTAKAFQLLELEAEILIYVKLISRYGFPQTEGSQKIAELKNQKQAILDFLAATPA